ncbi:unnamed protein product [Acanthoscelides obtectus]|uniref:Uncharacterized protein n=1 Tax=Acanthoscelides obtectus TaxID=200917 RepID=A0A9P0P1H9_ACAOB|nr:unnamed protein product [Acanthoscelides obtectus]CAK1638049.1 TLR4 interactor with leucine rich repeats [Acanthoscelides obtectus]
MKVFLCLILLVQSFISGGSDQPPFCKSCECQITNTTTVRRIVSCRHDVERIIFIESNWKNEKNETFDYDIVSFQNGVLPNLTNIFPASSLVSLDLSYNDIISIGSNVFMNLKNMTTLILSHNDLEKIDPDVFKGFDKDGKPSPLNNLKELRLGNNKIRSLNPDVTDHITELEILDLSNNPLGPIDNSTLLAISKLSNLKLYLGNNKLSYLESELVARWDALLALDINDNPWTCECENQWLIEDLMPIYIKLNPANAKIIKCAAPIEMKDIKFADLFVKKSHMRCLDTNDARPDLDAAMLVGVLAGVLVAIPTILLLIFAYQRKWISLCGICDDSPAAYSRRFYNAASDDNF